MDLKESHRVDPDRHWYYQSKLVALHRAVHRYAPDARTIVDVGAGSGFFSRALAAGVEGAQVTCVDPFYPDEALGRRDGASFVRAISEDGIAQADVLLFIDVLEHVDDDLGVLRSYTDHARAGCLALVSVPAFASMWSAHDEFLEHRRRYRLSQVAHLVEAAGLDILHTQYLFGTLFPAGWVLRRLRRSRPAATDLKPMPRPVDRALTVVLSAEHAVGHNKVAGMSAFVVAQVPDRS